MVDALKRLQKERREWNSSRKETIKSAILVEINKTSTKNLSNNKTKPKISKEEQVPTPRYRLIPFSKFSD